MSNPISHLTDETFEEEVLQSNLPVLVDYWAEWCGPCKMIAPILDSLTAEYAGKLKISKLNIDDNQKTPQKYGVRGIPTLMIFRERIGIFSQPGSLSGKDLEDLLKKAKTINMDEVRKELENQ